MVKDTKALDVRTKMIGVLLRAARLKARRTLKECADQLGCTPHMVSQYEYGRRGISLPELELLAALFDLPVNHLWEEELAVFEEEGGKPRDPAAPGANESRQDPKSVCKGPGCVQ